MQKNSKLQIPDGWKLVKIEPSDALLTSMAVRSDHGLGMPGYYDGELFGASEVSHDQRLENVKCQMRQLYDEAIGEGFFKAPEFEEISGDEAASSGSQNSESKTSEDYAQVLEKLKAWSELQINFDEIYETFAKFTGSNPDSPMMAPIFAICTAHTKLISESVGDTSEWLEWFQYECEMGKKGMDVKFLGGETIIVDSIEKLAKVLTTD